MKIAHFARLAPHASGQYGTVKDLILAERSIGIDAQFIDCGADEKGGIREGLVDGEIRTVPLEWALREADIAIRHTSIPDSVFQKIPVILALHGRPENSFRLEQYDISPVISSVRQAAMSGKYDGFFTFWQEYAFYWNWITGGAKVQYVPAPLNFDEYTPEGPRHDFGQFKANINLLIADIWREDHIPFNLIFAAQYFKERYYPDTRLHIIGVSSVKKKCFSFLASLQHQGVIGQIGGVTGKLAEIYRSADILLTPNIIATRIIRESMASGLPIVAPHGCQYTEYTAEPRDYKEFARVIKQCYELSGPDTRSELRRKAMKLFNGQASAEAIKRMCEKILNGNGVPRWNAMSITEGDWDLLRKIIETRGIQSVVEFGPGISTELMDKMGVKVTAFETVPQWAERMQIKILYGTINIWNGKDAVSISGDMAVIDGPHHGRKREPSYKSVHESNIPIVFCHDIHRPEDMQWVDKYFKGWKELARNQFSLVLERPC